MIWLEKKTNWSCQLLSKHKKYIHACMTNSGGYSFDLLVIYGEREMIKRHPLWTTMDQMRLISNNHDWLVVSNFNEIRSSTEREGRGQIDYIGASGFNIAVQGISELDAISGVFTWCSDFGPSHTCTELDQTSRNLNWLAQWPQVRPTLLYGNTSDHASLFI